MFSYKKKKEYKKGFTLLEMLVVIGIIGILMGVGSVSFTAAQKRARDSKRRQDIEAISKSLEQYYADNNGYPLDSTCAGIDTYFNGGVPEDPKTGAYDFDGACSIDGVSFCVCATLEVEGAGNASARNGATCSFGGADSKDYFCIQNVQ